MVLLIQMLKKWLILSLVAVCTGVLLVAATLWWNVHLSSIIDIISKGNTLPTDIIMLALFYDNILICIKGLINIE